MHLFEDFLDAESNIVINENTPQKMKRERYGATAEEFLSAIYAEFGKDVFTNKTARKVKSQFSSKASYRIQKALVEWGYISKDDEGNMAVTDNGVKYLQSIDLNDGTNGEDEDGAGIAKGTKDITKLKKKRFKVPKPGKSSKYLEQMKTILGHMRSTANSATKTTFMLAGDPGTGKTSFIKSVSDLTGIPLVVIEAPHITQEHIINIPFLVLDGNKKHEGNVVMDTTDENNMKVVQAESNLVTILKSKRKRTPEQVQQHINRSKPLRDVQPLLQKRIDAISERYNSILFLDEFYRTSSIKIRNVLRNILNGKIGNDKIPKGVYIIMATNINDDGVEEIPLNQDFHVMDYDVSSKEDFMNYMYGKYVDNPDDYENEDDYNKDEPKTASGIAIDEDVWNAFMTVLEDSDLGLNDEDADVRFSPRRLEQFILYLNSVIPPQTRADVQATLSFIKNNFTNYLSGESMEGLKDKFDKMYLDLVKDSDIDLESIAPYKDTEWKEQLNQEFSVKMELGDSRSYIPVVSGLPGIGKTTVFKDIAKEKSMGFIQVDVSNLTPEDIIGMPIADRSKGDDNITTSFSEPNLYITIMKEYNEIIQKHRQEGRAYNVILLFDELNRTEVPVFNAIRQVLLEKKFSETLSLPEDIMITGAINPVDVGAIEFTSHTRDVLDIIPSAQSFNKLFKYIPNKVELVATSKRLGFNVSEAVSNCMSSLAEEFKSSENSNGEPVARDEQAFWWEVNGAIFYVSGREMTEAVALGVSQIEDRFVYDMGWEVGSKYTEEEFDKFIEEAVKIVANSFNATLKMVALKQDVQDFSKIMAAKLTSNSKYKSYFGEIKRMKGEEEHSLPELLKSAGGDFNYFDKGVVGAYTRYSSPSDFTRDYSEIVQDIIKSSTVSLDTLSDIIALTTRLNKSLTANNTIKHDFNNNLKTQAKATVKALLSDESFPLIDLMKRLRDDSKFKKEIEKYTNMPD